MPRRPPPQEPSPASPARRPRAGAKRTKATLDGPADLDRALIEASRALAMAATALAEGDAELCERTARTAERLIQAVARYRAQAAQDAPAAQASPQGGARAEEVIARLAALIAAQEREARAELLDLGWWDPAAEHAV
jgi:hypothetical protein